MSLKEPLPGTPEAALRSLPLEIPGGMKRLTKKIPTARPASPIVAKLNLTTLSPEALKRLTPLSLGPVTVEIAPQSSSPSPTSLKRKLDEADLEPEAQNEPVCKKHCTKIHPFANKEEMDRLFTDTYLTSKDGDKLYCHRYVLQRSSPNFFKARPPPDTPLPCSTTALLSIIIGFYQMCKCKITLSKTEALDVANIMVSCGLNPQTLLDQVIQKCPDSDVLKQVFDKVIADDKISVQVFFRSYLDHCEFSLPPDSIEDIYRAVFLSAFHQTKEKLSIGEIFSGVFVPVKFKDRDSALTFVRGLKIVDVKATLKALARMTPKDSVEFLKKHNLFMNLLIELL